MIDGLPGCPEPPDWQLDWPALNIEYSWLETLRECQQDSINHGEGDVWAHTRMVCEELINLEGWRSLSSQERAIVFFAALFHDIAKPMCRREELDGHISFRGHARRGAILTRKLLWQRNVPFLLREQITALVRSHLVPFFLIEREDSQRLTLATAQTTRCDHLALLAESDARGRICQDLQRLLDNIVLFIEQCKEHHCLSMPFEFPSDHARFLYFLGDSATPNYVPFEDFRCQVVLMSGMPGVGKDHWIREHLPGWPMISLDKFREEMNIAPTDEQGAVLQAAKARAKEYLQAGQDFVWNATNLSKQVRRESIRLFKEYGAKVRIVYKEVTVECQREQNQKRASMVPESVMEKILQRWELPDLTEAHEVEQFFEGG